MANPFELLMRKNGQESDTEQSGPGGMIGLAMRSMGFDPAQMVQNVRDMIGAMRADYQRVEARCASLEQKLDTALDLLRGLHERLAPVGPEPRYDACGECVGGSAYGAIVDGSLICYQRCTEGQQCCEADGSASSIAPIGAGHELDGSCRAD